MADFGAPFGAGDTVPEPPRPTLPAALVGRIRAALDDPTMFLVEKPEHMHDWVDRAVQRVAAALLGGCEVHEEHGVRGEGPGGGVLVDWRGPRAAACDVLAARAGLGSPVVSTLVRRLVISTPAEPVEEP